MFMSKGQISIEVVIVASVIFLIALLIFSHYAMVSDSITGMTVIKAEALRELNKRDVLYTISRIDFRDCGTGLKFSVSTMPATLDSAAMSAMIDYAREKIAQKTKWDKSAITIEFNEQLSC